MANHKLLFKRTYENRFLTSFNYQFNTCFDFGEYNERQNLIGGTAITECVAVIDITLMWYDEAGLSRSGAERHIGVFACKNMQVVGSQNILCLDHQYDIWPTTPVSNYGNCLKDYPWYASRQPNAASTGSPAARTFGYTVANPWSSNNEHRQLTRFQDPQGVYGFNSIEFAISKGSAMSQAAYTDYFSVVDVTLYEYA